MASADAPTPLQQRKQRNPSPVCFKKLITDHAVRAATGAAAPPPRPPHPGPLVPIFIGMDRQATCADDHVREQLLVRVPAVAAAGAGGGRGDNAAAAADCPTVAQAAARLCADLALDPRTYENFFADQIRAGIRPFQLAGWVDDDQQEGAGAAGAGAAGAAAAAAGGTAEAAETAAAPASVGALLSDPLRPGPFPVGGGLPLPAPRLLRLPVRVEAPGQRKRRRRGSGGGGGDDDDEAAARKQAPKKGTKQHQQLLTATRPSRPRLVFVDCPVWDVARPAASARAYAASAAADLGLDAAWAEAIAVEVSALVDDARFWIRRVAAAAAVEGGEGGKDGAGGGGGGRRKTCGASASASAAAPPKEEGADDGGAEGAAAVRELEAAASSGGGDVASLLPRLVEEDAGAPAPEPPLLVRLRSRRLEETVAAAAAAANAT